jgi:hypothetical protein
MPLGDGCEEQDRTCNSSIERADRTAHRDPDREVRPSTNRRRQALALTSDDDRKRSPKIGIVGRKRRLRLGGRDPKATKPKVRHRPGQVVDRTKQQMLDGPCRRFHRCGCERRLPVGRKDHAMDARSFGAAQKGANILRVLERVEDEDERRLGALLRSSEDVIDARPRPWLDDERDPLVPVESGDRSQTPAFDLDDRDSEARRMQHEPLEGLPPLRDDEQPARGPSGDERLFDGSPAGHELFVRPDQLELWRRSRPVPGTAALIPWPGVSTAGAR